MPQTSAVSVDDVPQHELTPTRSAEVVADVDVCVAGGGPAGIAAALAAARSGATVCLLEAQGFLGGNFTAASVGTICGLYVREGSAVDGFGLVTRGIAEEVLTALSSSGSAVGPVPFKDTAVALYVPWAAKRLFDHLVGEESRILLFLHALVSDVVVDRERGGLSAVVVATKQGPKAVRSASFIDATGDADLAFHSGPPVEVVGPLPGAQQLASMQFVMEHVDVPAALAAGLERLAEEIGRHGAHLSRDSGAVLPTFRPGEVIGAMTRVHGPDGGVLDTTDLAHATYGELEGRRLAEEAGAFLIEHMPGFAGSFLADAAPVLGVRETRHAVGRATLTGDDVTGGARFADAIAAGAWPREYHVTGRSTEYHFLPDGVFYQVPLGALRVAGMSNLWVAGRCASADHDAMASLRVMATSMAMGQAAGTAAALAASGTDEPGAVRDALRAHGAFVG